MSTKAAMASTKTHSKTLKEAQELLDSKLKEGETQRRETIANSVARNGFSGPGNWLPLGFATTGILGLGGFFYLKARGF